MPREVQELVTCDNCGEKTSLYSGKSRSNGWSTFRMYDFVATLDQPTTFEEALQDLYDHARHLEFLCPACTGGLRAVLAQYFPNSLGREWAPPPPPAPEDPDEIPF